MNLSSIRAAVTATAASSLACATAFASGVAIDMAITGLFHLSSMITMGIGALIIGADGWFGIWFFRKAYAVERHLDANGGYPTS